jgi:polyhydroxyalkanoate synthase
VTREFLAAREPALLRGQRMHGGELASAFSTLRANDLVWNYVVNNYLKGETPPAFDLLHWNADSANLPGPMYAYYLRELYLGNRLCEPNALTMAGEPIDLSLIAMPAYVLATHDDHIVPWHSAYRTTTLVAGPVTFTLGASGHIAGIVNPPAPLRRNHWIGDDVPPDADRWLAHARSVPGSWWPHWSAWLSAHAGRRRRAPATQGSKAHPALDAAPGRYVVERVA